MGCLSCAGPAQQRPKFQNLPGSNNWEATRSAPGRLLASCAYTARPSQRTPRRQRPPSPRQPTGTQRYRAACGSCGAGGLRLPTPRPASCCPPGTPLLPFRSARPSPRAPRHPRSAGAALSAPPRSPSKQRRVGARRAPPPHAPPTTSVLVTSTAGCCRPEGVPARRFGTLCFTRAGVDPNTPLMQSRGARGAASRAQSPPRRHSHPRRPLSFRSNLRFLVRPLPPRMRTCGTSPAHSSTPNMHAVLPLPVCP